VDDIRFGIVIRSLRIRRGWTQEALANRARVGRASRIERGHIGAVTLDAVRQLAGELEVRVALLPRWRGGELDRFLDRGHAALGTSVIGYLTANGWICRPEVSFSVYGERGSIDALAWHPRHRVLIVVELKTSLVDLQALISGVDRKARLAAGLAREWGWTASAVASWVVVSEGRTSRRRLHEHRDVLRVAFRADGRAVRGWLAAPGRSIRGLSFWP